MRVEVRALIVHDGTVVVNEERRQGRPRLSLPGGRVDRWESTGEALVREVKEELGVDVDCGEFVCAFEVVKRFRLQDLNLVFAATLKNADDAARLQHVGLSDAAAAEVFPPVLESLLRVPADGDGHWLGNVWREELQPADSAKGRS